MLSALSPFSQPGALPGQRCAGDLCIEWPSVDAGQTNEAVLALFDERRDVTSLAVTDQSRPIGLINRGIFLSQMSKPFHREVYDRKSCIAFMDKEPLIVEADTSIDDLTLKTVAAGEKALTDGFIITREGRFAGLGQGLQLMRAVADAQAERNRQIMHSIEYASVIQRAMLRTSREALAATLSDASLIWQPRDVVGGDFYHFAVHEDGWFAAIADCTGHGVPGAFMTLIASSALSQALDTLGPQDPSALLSAVNRQVKSLLGQVDDSTTSESNDGLDAACFWFDSATQTLRFAGARIGLHVLAPGEAEPVLLAPERMGVGYVDSDPEFVWPSTTLAIQPGTLLFATTDGLIDQIGGPRRIAFGKRRIASRLMSDRDASANALCEAVLGDLAAWQGTQRRRDDVTFFCARLGTPA